MKSAFVAALGAAVLVTLGASSAAQAAIVNFGVTVLGGSVTYFGASLDQSLSFDLDQATLLVSDVGPGDASGLSFADELMISASSNIDYGAGTGPKPLGANFVLSWPLGAGPGTDMFTETLTTAESINRATADAITLTLSGTLSDTSGSFTDSPVVLVLSANQAGGAGGPIFASFTDMSSGAPAIPETSTWAMVALGFAALGYAASRRRKTNLAVLSA